MRFGSAAFRNAKEMGPRKHACWTPDFVDVLVSFLFLTGGRGMASVDVRFDLPPDIIGGLATGDLVRRGGVIQQARGGGAGGRTVAWLRDVSSPTSEPGSLVQAASDLGKGASILSQVGSIASVINLGATVAFGVMMLQRFKGLEKQLSRIENSVRRLEDSVQTLSAQVECGFFLTLQGIDRVVQHLEAAIVGELRAAVTGAWTAQLLQVGSLQRIQRIEQALQISAKTAERLKVLAAGEIKAEILRLSPLAAPDRIKKIEPATRVIQRMRQVAFAGALEARLLAEGGQLEIAAERAEYWHSFLSTELQALMKSFLYGTTATAWLHDELLHAALASAMPTQRIGRWMKAFDPALGDLDGLVSFVRKQSASTGMHHKQRYSSADATRFSGFAEAVEGLNEDTDRIDGLAPEFRTCEQMGLPLQGYREMLAVMEAPETARLAIIVAR